MNKPDYHPLVRNYLLSVLADHDHGIDNPTEQQLFGYAKDRFFSEYGWAVDRMSKFKAIREWLLGLALNVDFSYYDIEQRLLSWGMLDGTENDFQYEKALDQYWDRLAFCLYVEF